MALEEERSFNALHAQRAEGVCAALEHQQSAPQHVEVRVEENVRGSAVLRRKQKVYARRVSRVQPAGHGIKPAMVD